MWWRMLIRCAAASDDASQPDASQPESIFSEGRGYKDKGRSQRIYDRVAEQIRWISQEKGPTSSLDAVFEHNWPNSETYNWPGNAHHNPFLYIPAAATSQARPPI